MYHFLEQNFAKKLVRSDRTSLFLVDNKTKELYARVFDMGEDFDESNPSPVQSQKEIRFAIEMSKSMLFIYHRYFKLLKKERRIYDFRFITLCLFCSTIF